jgi:hypothetical protein
MKRLSVMLAFWLAFFISFGAIAQTSKTTSTTKTEQTKSTKTEKKPADARTKTGDKINHALKGPNGETVYTGPNSGNYYLTKKGNKEYLKK